MSTKAKTSEEIKKSTRRISIRSLNGIRELTRTEARICARLSEETAKWMENASRSTYGYDEDDRSLGLCWALSVVADTITTHRLSDLILDMIAHAIGDDRQQWSYDYSPVLASPLTRTGQTQRIGLLRQASALFTAQFELKDAQRAQKMKTSKKSTKKTALRRDVNGRFASMASTPKR